MANYQNLQPPIVGKAVKVFSNVSKLRNKSKAWESHRTANHEIMLPVQADNMTIGNLNVVAILELAATTLMTLRMKDISGREEDFYPLNDQNWHNKSDLPEIESSFELTTIINENDILTSIEKITKAIYFEYIDDGEPRSRNGSFSDNYHDDEAIARKIVNHFYDKIANQPKKNHKDFYRAIGNLFSTNLTMLKRNNLYFNIFLMSRSQAETFSEDMSNEQKEAIIRRETNPNHRNSFLCAVDYEGSKSDAKMIDKLRENILRKQSIYNKNYYKVIKKFLNISYLLISLAPKKSRQLSATQETSKKSMRKSDIPKRKYLCVPTRSHPLTIFIITAKKLRLPRLNKIKIKKT